MSFARTLTIFVLAAAFLLPTPVSALGISFGGRIIFQEPCISVLGPSSFVIILPAGRFPISYIWTPATITNLVGPPVLGGQVLGIADIPFSCWSLVRAGLFGIFSPVFAYSYGLRMQYIGTSFPSI